MLNDILNFYQQFFFKKSKIKISFLTDSFFNNECFNYNSLSNKDNYQEYIIQLKTKFLKTDIDLSTSDINSPTNSDIIIQYGTNIKVLMYLKK